MIPVLIPDMPKRPLAFYLAVEEWLAMQGTGKEYFMIWQVAPSVIIGRNQLLHREINPDFCREHGIEVFRRKSGGGAVFADRNNLMLSLITDTADAVEGTFSRYTSMVAASLCALGLNASDNARNDILVDGRKVSGNAYLHLPGGRSIVHGTMLYDCDPSMMAGALTPSASKLQSHGVQSVRSRITTLHQHLPELTINELRAHLMKTIPDEAPYTLTPSDLQEIETIEIPYHSPEWLRGNDPCGTLCVEGRIDGVGEVDVWITTRHGLIKTVEMRGDYLETGNASAAVAAALSGVTFSREAVAEALNRINIPTLIPGLTATELTDRLFRN